MSMVELLFVVGLILPPAVVVVGGILLALPTRRSVSHAVEEAHAH